MMYSSAPGSILLRQFLDYVFQNLNQKGIGQVQDVAGSGVLTDFVNKVVNGTFFTHRVRAPHAGILKDVNNGIVSVAIKGHSKTEKLCLGGSRLSGKDCQSNHAKSCFVAHQFEGSWK